MNFEELEANTATHIIWHYSNSLLNQDYSCFVYYPIPPEEEISDSFKNFWIWFRQEFQADTFSAHTIVSFNLFEIFISSPPSEYRTAQLSRIADRLLISIRFLRRPFSAKVLPRISCENKLLPNSCRLFHFRSRISRITRSRTFIYTEGSRIN